MKTRSFRPRDRRALLLGLVLVAPVLLYQLAVAPYVAALAEVTGQIDLQRDLLSRELTAVAESPGYPDRSDSAAAALQDQTERLFSGPDPLSAAAALVNYVSGEARRRRVLVQQSETRTAEPAAPGVVTLQIEVRGMSDLEGLLGLLTGLEVGEKLVRVEEISIEQPERRTVSRRDEEVLTFTAIISGYGLSGGSDDPHGFGIVTIGGGR